MPVEVIGDAPLPVLPHEFVWTRKKRKAVKLLVRGWTVTRAAEELGVHRMTVQKWKALPEFRNAILIEAQEYTQRMRFKRVHETGLVADQLIGEVARGFQRLKAQGGELTQSQINALQLFMREYREFRGQERADFGDNVQRVEGTFSIGGLGALDPVGGAKGAQSFKSFVEENMSKIPPGLVERARNPGEALILATRALVQETNILDELSDEDKAAKLAKS